MDIKHNYDIRHRFASIMGSCLLNASGMLFYAATHNAQAPARRDWDFILRLWRFDNDAIGIELST